MLFKYLNQDRIDVLENLKIRFSPLMSLNDPFECRPLIKINKERNIILSEMLRDLDEIWEKLNHEDKTEENKILHEKTKSELMVKVEEKMNSSHIGQKVIEIIGDNFGVLSLSRTEDNLLMWSHYTNNGQGMVIGFNKNHEFFNQPAANGEITKPIPVIYTNKRSNVSSEENNLYEKLLCEKPRDWAYEEEERIFRVFTTKENCVRKGNYGTDVILSSLPKEAIKSIYLGYNISESLKSRIFAAIRNNYISCDIFQANISMNEYKIEFTKLPSIRNYSIPSIKPTEINFKLKKLNCKPHLSTGV